MNITLVNSKSRIQRLGHQTAVSQTITLSDDTVWSKVTLDGPYDLDEFDVDFSDAGDDIHSMLEAWHWYRRTVSDLTGEVVDELFQEQGCFNILTV